MRPSSRRLLDFDVECVAAGYADPEFVPHTVTAYAFSWGGEVVVDALPVKWFYDEKRQARFLEPLLAAIGEAGVLTGHNICMSPETRVLTADLRWVAAGDLRVGDRVVAFDEHPSPGGRRRVRFATVLANNPRMDDVYAVELENGQVLYANGEHPWYVGTRNDRSAMRFHWRPTTALMGDDPVSPGRFAKQPAWLFRAFDTWDLIDTRNAGWIAGFFDGEGTLGAAGSAGRAIQVAASQNPGPLLDHAVEMLRDNGFPHAVHSPRSGTLKAHSIRINGGFNTMLRFLGSVRPERLLARWQERELEQALRQVEMVRVKSVRPVGKREVAGLSTSASTYFAEGFAVHNCRFDLPVLKAAAMYLGLPVMRPTLVQDTIQIRRAKGFKKGQDNIGVLLNVPIDKLPLNHQQWRRAYAEPDLATVKERVSMDVRQHMLIRRAMLDRGWLSAPKPWHP